MIDNVEKWNDRIYFSYSIMMGNFYSNKKQSELKNSINKQSWFE